MVWLTLACYVGFASLNRQKTKKMYYFSQHNVMNERECMFSKGVKIATYNSGWRHGD